MIASLKKYRLIAALVLVGLCLFLTAPRNHTRPLSKPNIILIVTDDQWSGSEFAMPITQAKLWDRSVVFDNAYTTTPMCCPARAGILTGKYGHNNGVLRNTSSNGGYASFDASETLGVWLDRASYETAMIGKYLVGYNETTIPLGWDEWQVFTSPLRYTDYSLNENGIINNYQGWENYSTDLLFDRGMDFIRANQDRPFFLHLIVYAPHAPLQVKPEDANLFSDYLYSAANPAFNEADMSDKPSHLQGLPLFNTANADSDTRNFLRLLAPVDRGMGELMDLLDETELIDNTIIIYMSDNGVLRGEHRLDFKGYPYEEAIRIPLSIYAPKAHQGVVNHNLALNIDIAPTILDLAGIAPPNGWRFDGQSLAPELTYKHTKGRKWFYIEYLSDFNNRPSFWGVHTTDSVYIEHSTGEREYYDLRADPYQLDNAAANSEYAKQRAKLEDRLSIVRDLMQPYLQP